MVWGERTRKLLILYLLLVSGGAGKNEGGEGKTPINPNGISVVGYMHMMIIPGSASKGLANSLAKETGARLAGIEAKRFPDGEGYVRIHEDISGKHVVLVQTTYPDPNILEFLFWVDAIREFEVKKLTAVIPYYGYARQDKKFNTGEPISARALARHFSMGIDAMVLVDIHNKGILQWFGVPVVDVTGMPPIAHRLKQEGVDTVLSPDRGAKDRAKTVAEIIGCPWDHLEKTRIDGSTVVMKTKNLDVKGKTVAITDDIIATGGTMITAANQLREQGAKRVIAACTHGLFASNALPRLQQVFDAVISTDTLENPTSVVTVAGEIGKVL